MRNQSKNRARKEHRRVMNENRRLLAAAGVAAQDSYVFPDCDCAPKKPFGLPEILLIAFIVSVALALIVR